MAKHLLSDADLLGRRFYWSGMLWTVVEIKGDRVLALRDGEQPPKAKTGQETDHWLNRETVEALVFASSAYFPKKVKGNRKTA